MSGASLSFVPLLPWPVLAVLAVAIVAVVGLGLWRRARGIVWRGAMLALGLLALANPAVVREERQPLEDVAVLLVDRSPSQEIGDRLTLSLRSLADANAQPLTPDAVHLINGDTRTTGVTIVRNGVATMVNPTQ